MKFESTKAKLKHIDFLPYKLFFVVLGIIFFILHFTDPSTWVKPLSYFATCLLPFTPDFLSLFNIKISRRLQLVGLTFIIPAMIFGIDLDFYRLFDGYDKAIHALSGIFTTLIAVEAIKQGAQKTSPRFKLLFMISFVGLAAISWEIFEFTYDHTVGGTMQQLISQGLDDTMWDIIFATGTGLITSIFLHKRV